MRALRAFEKALSAVELAASLLAAVALAMVMVIVATDVAMRYVLNRPFAWAYDFVSLYVIVALFFLALSRTYAVNGHISVDLLHHFLSAHARRFLEVVICACSAVLFALIAVAGARRAWSQFAGDEVIAGPIPWPAWISAAFVPFGCALITVRLVVSLLCHLTTLATGTEVIPLPAVAGSRQANEKDSFE